MAARFTGTSVQRVEDPRILTGQGRYVADIHMPGMLHAAFVRSPIAHGRILSIDATAARDLAGVHAVLTDGDLRDHVAVVWVVLHGLRRALHVHGANAGAATSPFPFKRLSIRLA